MSRLLGIHLTLAALLLLTGCEVGVETPPTAQGNLSTSQSPGINSNGASTAIASHGNLEFVDGYQAGYDRAVAEGKPMLVFFTADWCHFCHQMADDAFTNPQVVGLAERFACIRVDADAEPEVCRKFRVQGYPTVQFLSPRGAPLNRLVGKKPSHQVMMAMQAALQNVARKTESPDTKLR